MNVVNSQNLCDFSQGPSEYDAFGNTTVGGNITSIGYGGAYSDSETGLLYLTARFYDPEIGRFTQEDDWLSEGPNLYIYCKNNPIMFCDPTGHCDATTLAYYRKRGDLATLEKVKKLATYGKCDPKYHDITDTLREAEYLPVYSLTADQYNQIINSVFNKQFKKIFGLNQSGYAEAYSTSNTAIQFFTTSKYEKSFFTKNKKWLNITYIFISLKVSEWKKLMKYEDFYNEKFMGILSTAISISGDIYDDINGGYVGFNASLFWDEIIDPWLAENTNSVLIDSFSRYVYNAVWDKNNESNYPLLFCAINWQHVVYSKSGKSKTSYYYNAYPWSDKVNQLF